MLDLENRLYEHDDRLKALAAEVEKVDERALGEVKEQLSSAIGEAMLVRIELDRLAADTDEKLDKSTLRMAEIEAQLSDTMDVSAAVQLERLEELERAIIELDPNQFVRRTDPGQPGLGATPPSETTFSAF
jgi:regulator of replication initiation timing